MSEKSGAQQECERLGGTWKRGRCKQPKPATTSDAEGDSGRHTVISPKQGERIAKALRRDGIRYLVLLRYDRHGVPAQPENVTPEALVELLQGLPRELV